MNNVKVFAFDLDGTLTQHKSKLSSENRAVLEKLGSKAKLLMAGAGQCRRIFDQMDQFPIDIIGNYGMQYCTYNPETKDLDVQRNESVTACDKETIEQRVTFLREKYGFTAFKGDNVEYHPSGCITFPILGTKADLEDKLTFDPDRAKRRKIYDEVVEMFPEYVVFVGGSSSFDMAPKPYNKYYALDLYCKERGIGHDEVVYVGDDYGLGGNDESVYKSDIKFVCVDDYTKLAEYMKEYLED